MPFELGNSLAISIIKTENPISRPSKSNLPMLNQLLNS